VEAPVEVFGSGISTPCSGVSWGGKTYVCCCVWQERAENGSCCRDWSLTHTTHFPCNLGFTFGALVPFSSTFSNAFAGIAFLDRTVGRKSALRSVCAFIDCAPRHLIPSTQWSLRTSDRTASSSLATNEIFYLSHATLARRRFA